jgi:putative sterol carrier protein
MSTIVRDYFERLPERADPETVANLSKTCVFEVGEAGTWTVAVVDGEVRVHEGDGEGDCRVALAPAVMERILRGEQKPTSAYLTGKMRIRGELAALMRMQVLLDATG